MVESLTLRDARASDIGALCRIRGKADLHKRRIAGASGSTWRYLVVEAGGQLVAFGCLLLGQPDDWPEIRPLPKIVDLCVRSERRSGGIGRWFVREMERITAEAGFDKLWLSVDPEKNPRALAFYQRLGYEPLTDQWQWMRWSFHDAKGQEQIGQGWDLTLSRRLAQAGPGCGD